MDQSSGHLHTSMEKPVTGIGVSLIFIASAGRLIAESKHEQHRELKRFSRANGPKVGSLEVPMAVLRLSRNGRGSDRQLEGRGHNRAKPK